MPAEILEEVELASSTSSTVRDRPGTIFRQGTSVQTGAGDAIGDVHTTTPAPAPFTRRGRGHCENREKRSI